MKKDLGTTYPEMFEKVIKKLSGKPKDSKFIITKADKASLTDFLSDVGNNCSEEKFWGIHILEVPITGVNKKTGELELQAEEIEKVVKMKIAPKVAFFTTRNWDRIQDMSDELKEHVQILRIKAWLPYLWVKVYATDTFNPFDKIQKYKELPYETKYTRAKWVYKNDSDLEKECRNIFYDKKMAYKQDIKI